MKKAILALGMICFMLVVFISGCTQQNNKGNEGSTTGKTLTMTAKELNDDMSVNSDWSTYFTIAYNSLEDGDTLILQDKITNISYDSVTNSTMVKFEWTNGSISFSIKLAFEGNITGSYIVGDNVTITQKIKHVTFTYQNLAYDIELFEDQWESQDYFSFNAGSALGGLKPLPQSCIAKA